MNDAEFERSVELILTSSGELFYTRHLGEGVFGLGQHLPAEIGDDDVTLSAFEQCDTEFLFQMLYRHTQARLADKAFRGRAAEMTLTRHRHRIAQFLQSHKCFNPDSESLSTSY